MRINKRFYAISVIIAVIAPLFVSIPAQAAPVTATGTNPSVCNQDVGNALNVVAYRLSGGDCVIEFKNVGSTTWTVPGGVTSVSLLVIGGGGGGGSRHGGGGGGGGVVYAEYFPVSGIVGIAVGGGGTGGASAIGGTSGSDSRLFANGEATAGSTGIIAKGGGFGDFYQFTSGNKFIGRAGDGGSGGGTAVPNPFTRDLGSSPWGNTDPRGYTIQGSQNQKNLSGNTLTSNVWQYGSNGAQGGNQDYWSGGGGGGAAGEGSRGGGAAGTNNQGGAGGAGVTNAITDSSLSYGCGGGGGGGISGGVAQSGGAGGTGCGGGSGSTGNAAATNGAANRGGGGGGGGLAVNGTNGAGGAGGAGIVIVRYTPDTTAPTISTAVLNSSGTSIVLTYNETLSATTAATSAFSVSDSGTAVTVSSVTASGFTITLALASTINIGRVVTLSYTDPTGSDDANAIQDSIGNDAISLSSRSVTNNSTVKATPTFSSWSNVTKTYGDANYTVTAPTVTGSLAGSFAYSSSNTGVISISSSTFTVAGGGSATITATFTPTDTANYNSATTTNTVTVNKAAQSAITITPATATYGSNLTLASTGGSTGGTYTYTKVSGNCTLSGAVLTPTATGSCVVQSSLATTSNYLAETSTATTITIASGSVSASLTLAPGNLTFRQAKNITAVATVAGKITFKVAGKVIPGCKNKTVNAGNSFTTTCSYRPSNHSYVTISATLDPTDSFYVGTVTNSAQYLVTRRVGSR